MANYKPRQQVLKEIRQLQKERQDLIFQFMLRQVELVNELTAAWNFINDGRLNGKSRAVEKVTEMFKKAEKSRKHFFEELSSLDWIKDQYYVVRNK